MLTLKTKIDDTSVGYKYHDELNCKYLAVRFDMHTRSFVKKSGGELFNGITDVTEGFFINDNDLMN